MNNNWKNILEKNGFTEEEIKVLEPYCDDYTIIQIEKDPQEFISNMHKYLNPSIPGRNSILYLILSKKGYSEEQIGLIYNFITVNMDIKEHLTDSSLYKFIDDFITLNIQVDPGLIMNANRRHAWHDIMNYEGLTNDEIFSMARIIDDEKKFNYNDRFEYALEFGNIPTEDLKTNTGIKVTAERVQFDLKKRGYSDEAINRIVFYSKLGYLDNGLGQTDSIDFEKNDELIKLEKRMQELLENGFDVEDVIFITIIGMLNQDDLTIKRELEESTIFRKEHASEISSLYNASFPYNGATTIQSKYLKYKKEKLSIMLDNYGLQETSKDEVFKESFWKKVNLSDCTKGFIKRNILKDYNNNEAKSSIKTIAKGSSIVIGGTGLCAGSLVLLSALHSNQVYTLVSNHPEAVALTGVVVVAAAGLAAIGFATDVVGFDIGGRSR